MPVCISHMHTQTEKRERVKTHTLTYYQTRHYITCILDYRFYFLLFDISIQHFNFLFCHSTTLYIYRLKSKRSKSQSAPDSTETKHIQDVCAAYGHVRELGGQ